MRPIHRFERARPGGAGALVVAVLGSGCGANHSVTAQGDGADQDAGACSIASDRCPGVVTAATPTVATTEQLVAAVTNGAANAVVIVAPGTYELTEPLRPKPGMTIRGAGAGATILRNAPSFAPDTSTIDRDEGVTVQELRCDSYLVALPDHTENVTLSDLTLTGPQLRGALCGIQPNGLVLARLELVDFLWSGVRTYDMTNAHIYQNTFVDAGGKSQVTTGSSGGGLFLTYTKDSEIADNHFSATPSHPGDYYGVKGREARNTRIHHNTIDLFFSIELPFENDWSVEIDHNWLGGAISIPKYAGGNFPDGGYTFHIHHNYFTTSYSLEYQRNAIEIDHNLFDFSPSADGGNLISGFDPTAAPGGTRMHDNLIRNPGLGLYWSEGVYDDFEFYNNHVRGQTTVTPRTEGLFDFRPNRDSTATDWTTIQIRDNVFELDGQARPLMRNAPSDAARIENNTLANISDVGAYTNADTGAPRGPLEELHFRLGARDEWTLDQWSLTATPCACPLP